MFGDSCVVFGLHSPRVRSLLRQECKCAPSSSIKCVAVKDAASSLAQRYAWIDNHRKELLLIHVRSSEIQDIARHACLAVSKMASAPGRVICVKFKTLECGQHLESLKKKPIES